MGYGGQGEPDARRNPLTLTEGHDEVANGLAVPDQLEDGPLGGSQPPHHRPSGRPELSVQDVAFAIELGETVAVEWRRVCCVAPTRGMLKARRTFGSDCDRELGEGNRHAAVHWLLGGQLIVSSPEVPDEGMAGDDHPGAGVLLEPPHWSQPRL
jgi:hypothetical protein